MDFEILVSVTLEDVAFVNIARQHYKLFAEQAETTCEDEKFAGKMRQQEFHAEQFLKRIKEAMVKAGCPKGMLLG